MPNSRRTAAHHTRNLNPDLPCNDGPALPCEPNRNRPFRDATSRSLPRLPCLRTQPEPTGTGPALQVHACQYLPLRYSPLQFVPFPAKTGLPYRCRPQQVAPILDGPDRASPALPCLYRPALSETNPDLTHWAGPAHPRQTEITSLPFLRPSQFHRRSRPVP